MTWVQLGGLWANAERVATVQPAREPGYSEVVISGSSVQVIVPGTPEEVVLQLQGQPPARKKAS